MVRAFSVFSGIVLFSFSSSAEERRLPWAFLPLAESKSLPPVQDTTWPKNRIDYFILNRLESSATKPSPQADPRTLARRLSFDLTGLPPEEDNHFQKLINGEIPVEDEIERLLATPQYGERWARHWLDLARYTDTTASWLKSTAGAWRYRDWVVESLNRDMPYPEFVKRQLAADLMPGTKPEDAVALGFLGLSPTYWKELQLPPEIIKTTVADEWEERVDALGRTFLGLTLACARCHDHKTDPISAADYYAIAGVFASVKLSDRPLMKDELWLPVKAAREKVTTIESKVAAVKKKKPKDFEAQIASLNDEITAIKDGTPHYNMPMANGVIEAALFVKPKVKGHGTLLDFKEGKGRDLELQKRGDPNDLGDVVMRRFLSAFPSKNGEPRHFTSGSGRLELAEALIEDSKPLFARVIVNRIWKQHFGRGLVDTPSDFGRMGEKPTHPALLDDLASQFIENNWSIKWLHREILNSATWQQSANSPVSESADPDNYLYSRMNRKRLDIESWRDSILAVSGTLDKTIGGAPGDLDDRENYRRTIYGKINRRDMNKMLQVHDFPDPAAHNPKRTETISPLQSLFALNGPLLQQQAGKLVERIEDTGDPIANAYSLLFQRKPSALEREAATLFLKGEPLEEYVRVLLASNEFLFID